MYDSKGWSKAKTQMMDTLRQGVGQGIKMGADEIQLVGKISAIKNLSAENKELTLASSNESQDIGVKVHKGLKKGTTSLNRLSTKEVAETIGSALDLAKFSVEDPFLNLPTSAGKPHELKFLFDDSLFDLSPTLLKEVMKEAIGRVNREPRILLERLDLEMGMSFDCLFTSRGIENNEEQTSISWSFMGMAKEGDQVSGMDYDSGFSYHKKGFEEKLFEDLDDFAQRIVMNLNPKKSPSYQGQIILSPRAFSEIILEVLLYHASGRVVMDDNSKWAKSIGNKVSSDLLTIIDNPHDPRLAGATTYDGDGLPTKKVAIVEHGILKCHLLDCYSAKKLGTTSNHLSGGPFGLNVGVGKYQRKDLLALAPGKVLYVDRFSGNVDALTGDFSGVAKSSHLYENGEHLYAVTETMIAGNVFDLIGEIVGIGKEQHLISDMMACPEMVVGGVNVSGK